MLSMRLKPIGKKKQISYRLVVSEKRSKLDGRFVEDLGFYNPHSKEVGFKLERIKYWLEKGAQPSDTVYNLFIKEKILEGEKRKIAIKHSPKKEEEVKIEAKETTSPSLVEAEEEKKEKKEDENISLAKEEMGNKSLQEENQEKKEEEEADKTGEEEKKSE